MNPTEICNSEIVNPPTYPARPVNGGPLPKARPKSGEWYYEPKYNGWRALVHVPTGTMFNRKGERLSIAKEFAQSIKELQELNHQFCRIVWLDCEALERRHGIGRGALIILDCLDEAARPYSVRRTLLKDLFSEHAVWNKPLPGGLYLPSCAAQPGELWETLQAINRSWGAEFYEGVVAKRADSHYPTQLRSPDVEFPFWMKHRWAF